MEREETCVVPRFNAELLTMNRFWKREDSCVQFYTQCWAHHVAIGNSKPTVKQMALVKLESENKIGMNVREICIEKKWNTQG